MLNTPNNNSNNKLPKLLEQVTNGHYKEFRDFLAQNNIKNLNLSGIAEGVDLTNLGKALQDTQVHTLNLAFNKIGPNGAAILGKALKDTQVHTLNLTDNNIGPDGAEKLGQALKGTQVHTLNLACNKIGPDGAAILGKALQGTQVHTLNLARNEIGPDGAAILGQALKDTQVHTLNLADNKIRSSGVEKLFEALHKSQVHSLNLSRNNIGDRHINEFGKTLQTLQNMKLHTLDLSDNNLMESAVNFFQALQCRQVYTLDLSTNNIRFGLDCVYLTKLTDVLQASQVHTLRFSNNGLKSQQIFLLIRQLRDTQVTTLDLQGTDGTTFPSFFRLDELIPDTFLLEVNLRCQDDSLNKALEKNRRDNIPYLLACLAQHFRCEKKDAIFLPGSEISPKKELGIFNALDKDVQGKILSKFPKMTESLAGWFQEKAKKAYEEQVQASADKKIDEKQRPNL